MYAGDHLKFWFDKTVQKPVIIQQKQHNMHSQ